jgi:hypothetical protein
VLGVLEAAEPELMSVLEPVVPAAEPEAPMEVPLPVAPEVVPMLEPVPVVAPAVVSVAGAVPMEPEPVPDRLPLEPAVVLLVVSLGDVVVDGAVLEVVEDALEPAPASSRLPQADRDRAAIRARAAHCAIGDLIIRNSLRVSFRTTREADSVSRCLRLTLVGA